EKGMRLLRASSAVVEHNGGRFNLIGVDYQRDHMVSGEHTRPESMLQEIEALVRRDMPNILLSHNPNSFRRAAELGIELSLAGHTHGGQVQVEIVDHSFSPARFMTNFIAGLYRLPLGTDSAESSAKASAPGASAPEGLPTASGGPEKHAALYVNRGLGTIGMPVRLGVPPEITLITLRASG